MTPEREREIRAWADGSGKDQRALIEMLAALDAARTHSNEWKEAARHFWFGRRLARQQEIRLKQRLWAETENR